MNNPDLLDFLLFFGLVVLVTIVYILLNKLIVWALRDDAQWHKKQGHLGHSKKEMENKKKWACDRLKAGYILFLVILALFLIIPLVV